MPLNDKYKNLQQLLSKLDTAAVAFSGGVDSTLLLKVVTDTIGPDKVLAITATSPIFPAFEIDQCRLLTQQLGVTHNLVATDELNLPEFIHNIPQRCYHCKHHLFSQMIEHAAAQDISVILEGSNLDDLSDYRPGQRALKELGILSPLLEAQLTKQDIRQLSRQFNLPTWDKQSFACLATRFPYGTEITQERLTQVGLCEDWLREQGFTNYRVRYHNDIARIEIAPEQMNKLLDEQLRQQLITAFKKNGFDYIALDLQGYRSGSMNETLQK